MDFYTNDSKRMTIENSGNVCVQNDIIATGITGNILTAIQTNITRVGTLTQLTMDGIINLDGGVIQNMGSASGAGGSLAFQGGDTIRVSGDDCVELRTSNITRVLVEDTKTDITVPLNVTGDINTTTDYNIGGTQVLSSTTLGTGIVNSSINTNTGDLTNTGIINVTTGNEYRINGNSVLNLNTLGSGIASSNLQTVGTLSGLDMGGTVTMGENPITGLSNVGLVGKDGSSYAFGGGNAIQIKGEDLVDIQTSDTLRLRIGDTLTEVISGNFKVNSDTIFVDATNDRVGINKVPTVDLDVNGDVDISGDVIVDDNMLVVKSQQVGIGLTNPVTRLHIHANDGGSSQLTGAVNRAMLIDGFNGNCRLYLEETNAGDTERLSLIQHSEGSLTFSVMGNTGGFIHNRALSIAPTGFVGIGTNPPAFQLDVEGAGNLNARFLNTVSGNASYLRVDKTGSTVQMVVGVNGTGLESATNEGYSGTINNFDYSLFTNNTKRLEITAGGQIKSADNSFRNINGNIVAGDIPYIHTHSTSSQSFTNSVASVVLFTTTLHNRGTFTYASGTGIFTVPSPGLYRLEYQLFFSTDASPSGVRRVFVETLTGAVNHGTYQNFPTTTDVNIVSGSALLNLTSTSETFRIFGYQTSGGSLTLSADTDTYCRVMRVGNEV